MRDLVFVFINKIKFVLFILHFVYVFFKFKGINETPKYF